MSSMSKKSQAFKKGITARHAIVAARKGFPYSILALMPASVIIYCSIEWLSGAVPSADGIATAMMISLGASAVITALAAIWAPNLIQDPHQKRIWFRFMIKTKSIAYAPPEHQEAAQADVGDVGGASFGIVPSGSCSAAWAAYTSHQSQQDIERVRNL